MEMSSSRFEGLGLKKLQLGKIYGISATQTPTMETKVHQHTPHIKHLKHPLSQTVMG